MPELLRDFIYGFNWFVFFFFVTLNTFYFIQLALAAHAVGKHGLKYRTDKGISLPERFIKPFSVIVPTYNEEAGIAESAASFLSLDYPEYEVIIVCDGSTDRTVEILKEIYKLRRIDIDLQPRYQSKPIREIYFSETEPRLVVICKDNGGKADSQNAGANLARYPYVCVVDADSLLSRDSMERLMREFTAAPRTVAVGGVIRLTNGCRIEHGQVTEVRMPRKFIVQVQVVEYLRAFLFGRMGLSEMKILMLISGAFGVFRQDILAMINGWDSSAIGDDFDLVVRMHRMIRRKRLKVRLSYAPDPVCWTEAPGTLRGLSVQRDRWQRGLMQVLFRNIGMFFNPWYGMVGLVGYPYFFIFEMMGAFVEVVGLLVIVISLAAGIVNMSFFLLFIAVSLLWGLCITCAAIALEEMSYRRFEGRGDLGKLLGAAVFENFGYRQLHSLWRLKGMVRYPFVGAKGWGSIPRTGFGKEGH